MIQEPPSRAWIAWVSFAGVIIAAIIGLGMPFAENLAARYLPPLTPTPFLIATDLPVAQIQTIQAVAPSHNEQTDNSIRQAQPNYPCYGKCWQFDETAKIMTWIGPTDGSEDIWQPEGDALTNVRNGYVTVFTTSVPGEMLACVLVIEGKYVKRACDGSLYQLPPGTYHVSSPDKTAGGFRWCPEVGYGWRTTGGDCK